MADITKARLAEKDAEIVAKVEKLLGEGYTPEEFERCLRFEAAWARILLEDQRSLLEKQSLVMVEQNAWATELVAELNKTGEARVTEVREQAARLGALQAQWAEITKQARPLVEKGDNWTEVQSRNGFLRHQDKQEEHKRWRGWQDKAIEADPKFRKFSKIEQARRLKKRHAIPDKAETIAKRLA